MKGDKAVRERFRFVKLGKRGRTVYSGSLGGGGGHAMDRPLGLCDGSEERDKCRFAK
jgi:hypothetical protein